jgi:hypothetical protein
MQEWLPVSSGISYLLLQLGSREQVFLFIFSFVFYLHRELLIGFETNPPEHFCPRVLQAEILFKIHISKSDVTH